MECWRFARPYFCRISSAPNTHEQQKGSHCRIRSIFNIGSWTKIFFNLVILSLKINENILQSFSKRQFRSWRDLCGCEVQQAGLTVCITTGCHLCQTYRQTGHSLCQCQVQWEVQTLSSAAPSSLPMWGAEPRGHLCTLTGTYTHRARGWKARAGGMSQVLLFSECRLCLKLSQPMSSKQPCPPPRTDLDLNTIIHSSQSNCREWQVTQGYFLRLTMVQLLVKQNYLLSPFPTLGLFWTCPVMDIQCLMHIPPVPKYVRVYGMWGCLFNYIKITLLSL